MDLRSALSEGRGPRTVCSAKGCRAPAVSALRWNNPVLHTPERRKVWLACPEHETSLREFLAMRGFFRDRIDVGDLGPHDG